MTTNGPKPVAAQHLTRHREDFILGEHLPQLLISKERLNGLCDQIEPCSASNRRTSNPGDMTAEYSDSQIRRMVTRQALRHRESS
jgi:hypothetical protein